MKMHSVGSLMMNSTPTDFANNFFDVEIFLDPKLLVFQSLRDLDITIEELKLSLKRNHIVSLPTPNRTELTWEEKITFIQYALFGAFYPNYFVRSESEYRQLLQLIAKFPPNRVII